MQRSLSCCVLATVEHSSCSKILLGLFPYSRTIELFSMVTVRELYALWLYTTSDNCIHNQLSYFHVLMCDNAEQYDFGLT